MGYISPYLYRLSSASNSIHLLEFAIGPLAIQILHFLSLVRVYFFFLSLHLVFNFVRPTNDNLPLIQFVQLAMGSRLKGEKDARAHVEETGHIKFAEYWRVLGVCGWDFGERSHRFYLLAHR